MTSMRNWPPLNERFWSYVVKDAGPGDCWGWRGPDGSRGYGMISEGRRGWKAHRLSWTLHRGPIPPGLSVLHRCDNPPCCNPDHLFVGTHADNFRDMMLKRRHRGLTFDDADARTIRLLASSGLKLTEIAKECGCVQSTVWNIVNRKGAWARPFSERHPPFPPSA